MQSYRTANRLKSYVGTYLLVGDAFTLKSYDFNDSISREDFKDFFEKEFSGNYFRISIENGVFSFDRWQAGHVFRLFSAPLSELPPFDGIYSEEIAPFAIRARDSGKEQKSETFGHNLMAMAKVGLRLSLMDQMSLMIGLHQNGKSDGVTLLPFDLNQNTYYRGQLLVADQKNKANGSAFGISPINFLTGNYKKEDTTSMNCDQILGLELKPNYPSDSYPDDGAD